MLKMFVKLYINVLIMGLIIVLYFLIKIIIFDILYYKGLRLRFIFFLCCFEMNNNIFCEEIVFSILFI